MLFIEKFFILFIKKKKLKKFLHHIKLAPCCDTRLQSITKEVPRNMSQLKIKSHGLSETLQTSRVPSLPERTPRCLYGILYAFILYCERNKNKPLFQDLKYFHTPTIRQVKNTCFRFL